ncbi:hypothetical protein LCGC14_0341240 [marine sediment metagenome]|uniref:Uncharacterized protein n=1 Tax=marine sediment metagenome TaxID=412755 RepID=A0A0F9TWP7_9ZZZZ
MYSRWIALGILVTLLCLIMFVERGNWRRKLSVHSMVFLEGMVGGLIIDSIGVNAGLYYFPRQPIYSLSYFLIVIPCWGVFGLLLNCLWAWVGKERFIKGMAVTLFPLFALYEGSNLLTNSWVYTTSLHVVVLGWTPLIVVFAGCHRRRKVVFKMDAWVRVNQHHILCPVVKVARVLVVIIMFPLLLISIYKIISDITQLNGIPVKEYFKEYLMIGGN